MQKIQVKSFSLFPLFLSLINAEKDVIKKPGKQTLTGKEIQMIKDTINNKLIEREEKFFERKNSNNLPMEDEHYFCDIFNKNEVNHINKAEKNFVSKRDDYSKKLGSCLKILNDEFLPENYASFFFESYWLIDSLRCVDIIDNEGITVAYLRRYYSLQRDQITAFFKGLENEIIEQFKKNKTEEGVNCLAFLKDAQNKCKWRIRWKRARRIALDLILYLLASTLFFLVVKYGQPDVERQQETLFEST